MFRLRLMWMFDTMLILSLERILNARAHFTIDYHVEWRPRTYDDVWHHSIKTKASFPFIGKKVDIDRKHFTMMMTVMGKAPHILCRGQTSTSRNPISCLPRIRCFSLFPGSSQQTKGTTKSPQPQEMLNTKFNGKSGAKKSAPILIPYSQSLPSLGHQWCSRCEIRAHAFQKPCHQAGTPPHDACAALPAGTICAPAKRYFRQQRNFMLGMAAIVFVVPSIVSAVWPALPSWIDCG